MAKPFDRARWSAAFLTFVKASAALVALFGGSLAIEQFRSWLGANFGLFLTIVVVIEGLIFLIIYKLLTPAQLPSPEQTAVAFRLRYGRVGDYDSIREIAREYFPASTSLDSSEYRQLLSPERRVVRVLEAELSNGGVSLIGYYSIWPITAEMFELMCSGKFKERNFKASSIAAHDAPANSVLYVAEVTVSKAWRNSVRNIWAIEARRHLRQLIATHPNITLIGAWIYTDEGEELASLAGLKPVARSSKTSFGLPFPAQPKFYSMVITEQMRAGARLKVDVDPFQDSRRIELVSELDSSI